MRRVNSQDHGRNDQATLIVTVDLEPSSNHTTFEQVRRLDETTDWLIKTFGEGFLTMFMSEGGFETVDNVVSGDVDSEEGKKAIQEFATKILNNIDPKEYTKYARIITNGIKCDGAVIDFQFHFVRKMGELHLVMFHILKHQYGDFLDAGAGDEST